MTSFVEVARREKLQELVRRGVAPYAYRFDRTATAHAPLEGFREGDARAHRLAGRLVALPPPGKTTLAPPEGRPGRIQLYFKPHPPGREPYESVNLRDPG